MDRVWYSTMGYHSYTIYVKYSLIQYYGIPYYLREIDKSLIQHYGTPQLYYLHMYKDILILFYIWHFSWSWHFLTQEYLKLSGDPKCIDDIHKDLDRQFPLHEMFLSKGGVG